MTSNMATSDDSYEIAKYLGGNVSALFPRRVLLGCLGRFRVVGLRLPGSAQGGGWRGENHVSVVLSPVYTDYLRWSRTSLVFRVSIAHPVDEPAQAWMAVAAHAAAGAVSVGAGSGIRYVSRSFPKVAQKLLTFAGWSVTMGSVKRRCPLNQLWREAQWHKTR